MEYVKEIEKHLEEGKKIIPKKKSGNEWDYTKFGQLCEHLKNKILQKNQTGIIEENNKVLASELAKGWEIAS